VGKTKAMKKYIKKYPGYINTDEDGTEIDIVPVAYMELPNPFTVQEFYQSIIEALGAVRTVGQAKIGDVKARAFELIKRQKVEMIIIDEMDYVQTSRAVKPKEAMQTFKHVSNQGNVSLVFIGGPETEELMEIGFQYFRRFPKTVLKSFEECDDEFCDFLKCLEEQVKPPFPIGLGDMKTPYPETIHKLSRGLVGIITPTIKEVYRLSDVFSKEFNDISKARFTGALLGRAYYNVIGDLSQKKIDTMIKQQKKPDSNDEE